MNTNSANGENVEALVAELLEARAHTTAGSDVFANLSVPQRAYAADLLLLDALLEQIYGRQSAHGRQRIERALATIARDVNVMPDDADEPDGVMMLPAEPPVIARRKSKVWWLPTALAASMIVAATMFLLQPSTNRAYAAVIKACQAMTDSTIREYRISIERNLAKDEIPATLWVSGDNRFALTHPAPLPGNFWLGSDGRERWFVPVIGPVVVSDDPGQPRRWLLQQEAGLPLFEFATLPDQLRHDYELTMLDEEHLRGRLRTSSLVLPSDVDVWIDKRTGVVRMLILAWPADSLRPGPRKVTLELANENAVGEEWFQHQSHHDPRRPVARAPRYHN